MEEKRNVAGCRLSVEGWSEVVAWTKCGGLSTALRFGRDDASLRWVRGESTGNG